MNKMLISLIIAAVIFTGCSNSTSPLNPHAGVGTNPLADSKVVSSSETCLWGFYLISIDPDTATVNCTLDRTGMFTANVVKFLNGKPPKLGFKINKVTHEADYTDIDIDISLTHPFPGLTQFNGYDVRGVFMGDGSASLVTGDVVYPMPGTDQYMLPNPLNGNGAPDGYTRWFNFTEFSEGGMPLFSYTQGSAASPGFDGTATLCPYKYFADGLDKNGDVFDFLTATSGRGIFSAGSVNWRNYYLRFPKAKGITYGYAVLANWAGPDIHPSNAPEAQAIDLSVVPDLYYVDDSTKGGKLILDMDVFGWENADSSPADYNIILESEIFTGPKTFDGMVVGVPGGDNLSTYHVEIDADNLTHSGDTEFWVILEVEGFDYTNDLGTPNLADTDTLAAFFRFPLTISDTLDNTMPVVTGIEDAVGSGTYKNPVKPTDIKTYYVIFTDPDVGQTHTFTWYVVDDGTGPPSASDEVTMPVDWAIYGEGDYDIYVDVNDGFATTQGGPFDITVTELTGRVITFGGPDSEYILGFGVDSEGGMYSCGYFFGTINLDPNGNAPHTQVGGGNMWVNKINADGTFAWGYSWPSINGFHCYNWALTIDSNDDVYVLGSFIGTMDFNPGLGVDMHTASGGLSTLDSCLMKFNKLGQYQWGIQWGGPNNVLAYDIELYNNTDLYITGYFSGTADLNPTSGVDNHIASGPGNSTNGYLIKIDKGGTTYHWGKDWGAGGVIYSYDIGLDASGNAAVTGTAEYTPDLDPTTGVQVYTCQGAGDSFVEKFFADGTWDWAFGLGGVNWDLANDVACDSSGNVYVIGGFSSPTLDFDPHPLDQVILTNMSNNYDGFMGKYDPDGDFIWVKQFATASHDNTWAIKFDKSDNLYLSGHTGGTIDLDPGPGVDAYASHGESDAWIVKLTTNAGYIWGSGWGGTGWDHADRIAFGPENFLYVVGKFSNTVDFNPSDGGIFEKTSNGNYDEFINILLPGTGEW